MALKLLLGVEFALVTVLALSDTVATAALTTLGIIVAAVAGVVNTYLLTRGRPGRAPQRLEQMHHEVRDMKRSLGASRRASDQEEET